MAGNNTLWHFPKNGELPEAKGKYKEEHYPQIPCLCKMKNNDYGVRYWNVKEQCFDTEDCDDYCCNADKVEKWLYIDDLEQQGA